MRALYEIIAKVADGALQINSLVLEFDSLYDLNKFKNNIEDYEQVGSLEIWRTVTNID